MLDFFSLDQNKLYQRRWRTSQIKKILKKGLWKPKIQKEIKFRISYEWFRDVFITFYRQNLLPNELIFMILGLFYADNKGYPVINRKKINI